LLLAFEVLALVERKRRKRCLPRSSDDDGFCNNGAMW